MNIKRTFLGLTVAAVLAGCATSQLPLTETEVVMRNNAAGDVLASLIKTRGMAGTPVVVASIVEVDDMEQSSTFGRMVGEQIASRLAFAGVPVVELKLRNTLYMSQKGGEFMLSRELQQLTLEHKASLAVVGTYAVANQEVLVTVKAVDVTTNNIVAAHSYSIPKTTVSSLLKK
jgi:TolB-like protein